MSLFSVKTSGQLDYLIKQGTDINYQDYHGQTLLHVLLQNDKSPDLVDYVLEQGADVNIPNYLGRTPIFYAKSPETIQKLRIKGAKIFARDHTGLTAVRGNKILDKFLQRKKLPIIHKQMPKEMPKEMSKTQNIFKKSLLH